jgi:hypothetical protein
MPAVRVLDFLPSRDGFRFANCFPPQPLMRLPLPWLFRLRIGNAANGLCGGMIFSACDLFHARTPPPACTDPPGYGSPLFRCLVRRLFASFHLPWGPLKYYRWMRYTDAPGRASLARRTVASEWPRVRREIDAGRPAALGLVLVRSANPFQLGKNHQVLAYGYALDEGAGKLTLNVYDPNRPGRDDLTLDVALNRLDEPGAIVASWGEAVRGFFWTPYRPSQSVVDAVASMVFQ